MTVTETDGLETLVRPSHGAARDLVAGAIERGAMVTVVGRCTVAYYGRAASTLGPGDRHVMLKPDGSALVHTDEGQKPVNWQPPECDHEVAIDDGALVVESHRADPDESLAVRFESVFHVGAYPLTDERDLTLTGTEDDLRKRIIADPALVEAGFEPLATERQTPAGAVDLYGEDADGRPVVVELKRRRAGPDAVGQLRRYVDALEREREGEAESDGEAEADGECESDGEVAVRGILVAPSATDRARRLLDERGLAFVALSPRDAAD